MPSCSCTPLPVRPYCRRNSSAVRSNRSLMGPDLTLRSNKSVMGFSRCSAYCDVSTLSYQGLLSAAASFLTDWFVLIHFLAPPKSPLLHEAVLPLTVRSNKSVMGFSRCSVYCDVSTLSYQGLLSAASFPTDWLVLVHSLASPKSTLLCELVCDERTYVYNACIK